MYREGVESGEVSFTVWAARVVDDDEGGLTRKSGMALDWSAHGACVFSSKCGMRYCRSTTCSSGLLCRWVPRTTPVRRRCSGAGLVVYASIAEDS
jgi:hypothetical protein